MNLLFAFFKLITIGLAAATLLACCSPFVNPKDFWLLIFFGLAFPLIAVGNLLMTCFWFISKSRFEVRKIIRRSGVGLLFSTRHIPKIIGLNFPKKESVDSGKLLSFNVGGLYRFNPYGKHKRFEISAFYDFLEKEKFDLGCFQEFSPSVAEKFKNENSPFFKQVSQPKRQIIIGSNFKIIRDGKINFKQKGANGITWADVDWNNRPVRIYNMHLRSNRISTLTNQFSFRSDFFSKKGVRYVNKVMRHYKRSAVERVTMAEKLKAHIADCPYPIIICGDLNDSPVSYIYREISRGMTDVFVKEGFGFGTTYSGKLPGLRLDYFFVSPEIEPINFQIIKNDFSDHFAISCNVRLKEN